MLIFALERIHETDSMSFRLSELDRSYTCGRSKENDIICPNLLVSRRHCIFLHNNENLYVTDLRSTNGIFINGEKKESVQVRLQNNDIIGIGCSNLASRRDETNYVYRIRIFLPINERNEELVASNSCIDLLQVVPSVSPKSNVSKRKGIDINCEVSIQNKMLKMGCDNKYNSNNSSSKGTVSNVYNNQRSHKNNSTNNLEEVYIIDDDIEIVHTSLAKDVKEMSATNCNLNCNPELQTDDEEDANIESEECNTSNDISLIKLKKLKHDPKMQFSDIDVVNLSDDEDGMFPYSQLFDIKYEDNVDTKVEIKQECTNTDELNTENIGLLNVEDEVIVLTDSEDENNPWLDRLSRSQLLNDSKSVSTDIVVKDEIDYGIWDEISNEPFEIPSTDQVSSNKKILQSHASVYGKIRNKDDCNTNVQLTEINVLDANKVEPSNEPSVKDSGRSKKIISNNININLPIKEVTRMDVDEADPFNEPDAKDIAESKRDNDINIHDKSKQKTETEQTAKKYDETLESIKQKLTGKSTKKLIPVIEPLQLPSRRKQTVHSKHKETKVDETSQPRSISKETTSKNDQNLSKIKKLSNDNFYDKEQTLQKHNRKRSKSMSDSFSLSEILPVPGSFISKDEKKKIIENRKMKLKKIAENAAEEKKARENDQNINRRIAKPRAKISLKNRGDFLITEHKPQKSKSLSNNSTKSSTSKTDLDHQVKNNLMNSCKKTLKLHDKTNISKDTINTIATSLQQSLNLNNASTAPEEKRKIACKTIDDKNKHSSASSSNMNIASTSKILQDMSVKRDSVVHKKEYLLSDNLKSILVKCKNKSNIKKKKVSFSDKLDIKDYEIDSSNTLKKLEGKDAPIPTDKLSRTPVVYTNRSLKLEEFLWRIFSWNPVWLEQQRYIKRTPPIVFEGELQPMRLFYDSFKQYYEIAMPLLLLEIWCGITKDFETKNMQRATMMCSIVENSITYTSISSTNLFLTTLSLQVLINKEELNKSNHSVFGDLVYLEYVGNKDGKTVFCKVFGYITQMQQTIINEFTIYNRELRTYVKDPYTVITYTLLTRTVDHILVNRLHRVRTVTYLRSSLRMVQALQYLPQSPLMKMIVNPKIENYQLPPLNEQHASLVTKDNLNSKQLEAVFRVTDTVLKKDPKLCFIQGPPGTGKSKVIVNLVTQILYGNGEDNASLKILICAPSNAAIDEIVLRLLDIRSTLKQKRFNMVRIGRLESMHLKAKNISVSELAKRYLLKITKKPESNSIAEELTNLEKRIDSVRNELANLKQMHEKKRSTLSYCLFELSTRYDLLRSNKTLKDLNPKDYVKCLRVYEKFIISNANIIACTLSSCYTHQMESIFGPKGEKISVCIVDEATQSFEAETLIPLMLGVNTMVLVGDPNQLPATVLSQEAKKLGLDQSVFSRIQNVFASHPNSPIIMLDTQYRMDYAISYWPNKHFYKGRLKNANDCFFTFPLHPYRVLHHDSTQNDDKFSNTTEAEFIANIIFTMLTFVKWDPAGASVSLGVLTPYQTQRTLVINKINEKISSVSEDVKKKIVFEVNTVDSFQGQERDIIIMSCVRSEGIGFLSDKQRLCVALTRAKRSLILCGNFDTFMRDQMWKALLIDAKTRGIVHHIDANATPIAIKPCIIK